MFTVYINVNNFKNVLLSSSIFLRTVYLKYPIIKFKNFDEIYITLNKYLYDKPNF